VNLRLTQSGGEEIAAALRALPAKVRRRQLLAALRKAAAPIQGRAAELAPIDPRLPLHLKDWIGISPLTAAETSVLEGFRVDDYSAAVKVGPVSKVFWGLFVEFGYGPDHRAQPFMRPAFDYGSDRALSILREELWSLLESAQAAAGEGAG
jgi:hypothetical protein